MGSRLGANGDGSRSRTFLEHQESKETTNNRKKIRAGMNHERKTYGSWDH